MKNKKKKKMKIVIILGIVATLLTVSYNPLIDYLAKQAANPTGFVGGIVTKIWSGYFDELSTWSTDLVTISKKATILDVGYGGGSNIKNLTNLNQSIMVHGIDVSEESYQTASDVNVDAIETGAVALRIGDVAKLPYQDKQFDYIFAIQTHMYWEELEQGISECYRTLTEDGKLVITSEMDKIAYHLPKYEDENLFKDFLLIMGFAKVEVKKEGNYIAYLCQK